MLLTENPNLGLNTQTRNNKHSPKSSERRKYLLKGGEGFQAPEKEKLRTDQFLHAIYDLQRRGLTLKAREE